MHMYCGMAKPWQGCNSVVTFEHMLDKSYYDGAASSVHIAD